MAQQPKNSDNDKSQIERFRETARALGCDEDEAAFLAKLAVIGRQKPVTKADLARKLLARIRKAQAKKAEVEDE